MRVALFYHSLISDWNHGNAHFLRGVVSELIARGHEVIVYEPVHGWSLLHLLEHEGFPAFVDFFRTFPALRSCLYDLETFDLEAALDGVQLVIVHEWSSPELVARVGAHHARLRNYTLFFHDTHHRAVSEETAIAGYDLRDYDGVLAFGAVLRDLYLSRGWTQRAFVWHEAADTRLFRPSGPSTREGDLLWIGNWGDGERSNELHEYLLRPARELRLRTTVHGVRYPDAVKEALAADGIRYAGWIANHRVPARFAQFALTVHVPRRPYATRLTGIPTIRVFEALACGIPLVCAPWSDSEQLFRPGQDYLVAKNGDEMQQMIRAVLNDGSLARSLAAHGLETIRTRHTCVHRVDDLLAHRALVAGALS